MVTICANIGFDRSRVFSLLTPENDLSHWKLVHRPYNNAKRYNALQYTFLNIFTLDRH
jgi:hypothetical protein